MPSRWIEFVRKWAKDHDTTYACALSQPDCRDEYRAKYGNRKNLTKKKERELMGMEDFDAPAPKKKKPKKKMLIIESDSEEEDDGKPIGDLVPFQKIIDENKKKEQQKESRARWGMSAEDIVSRLSGQIQKAKETKGKALREIQKKALIKELSGKQAEKKRLLEMSRMMGEDYNVSSKKTEKAKKKKPLLIIEDDEEEVPAKKSRGRPRKYATKEEAYKAKIDQNRGYKQAEAKRIKELVEQMKNK